MRKNNNCNAKKKVCGAVTTRATADRCENDRTQRSAAAVNKIPPTCINTGTHSTLTSGAPNNGLTCAHARKNTFTHDKTWIRNNKNKKKIINKTHKHNSAQQHTFRVYFSFVLSLSLSHLDFCVWCARMLYYSLACCFFLLSVTFRQSYRWVGSLNPFRSVVLGCQSTAYNTMLLM